MKDRIVLEGMADGVLKMIKFRINRGIKACTKNIKKKRNRRKNKFKKSKIMMMKNNKSKIKKKNKDQRKEEELDQLNQQNVPCQPKLRNQLEDDLFDSVSIK